MKNNILKTYKRRRESDLVTIGLRIVEKMENNPSFPNPPASLADMKKILPEFQAALVAAKGRDKEQISIKNDKKVLLQAYITELAQYVTATCNGDRSLLLSSGFDVSGERASMGVPFIEKLEVELGPPGEATTRIKRIAGARAFQHQYSTEVPTSNTIWTNELSAHPSHTFKGLNSASKYWFRIAVVHNSGQTVYSPIVQKIIQ